MDENKKNEVNGQEYYKEKIKEVNKLADDYINFIDKARTEREIIKESIKYLEERGFKNIENCNKLSKGDKIYLNFKNKTLLAAAIGNLPFKFIVSHVDSPRLDLKVKPITEDTDIIYLKSHYYGGIKKYQWVTIPLLMRGVVVKKDGKTINIRNPKDVLFYISDILPHLGKKQLEKKGKEIIEGENLRIIIGSGEKKDEFLNILNKEYSITEEDFVSADIEFVPAFKPSYIGLDKNLIGGYGHDDRCCVFTSLMAFINSENYEKTNILLLYDKEEIGSETNTSLNSYILEYFISEILKKTGSTASLYEAFVNSEGISADVTAAYDPLFPGPFDKETAAKLHKGVALIKYTGHGGKYLANEAHAEYVAKIRSLLDSNKILWQPEVLGKIDEGGGGTLAKYLASRGCDVIDMGVPLLSMHSPYEVLSKYDLYSAYIAFLSFFQNL